MASAYYNEIDPYAAQWLRNLIGAGHIAPGDIKPNTFKQKRKPVDLLRQKFAMKSLPDVDARDIASLLDEYTDARQPRMAQVCAQC